MSKDLQRPIPMSDNESNDWFSCYQKWEEETRPIHATIQTIMDIPVGERRIFLCLDRNVLDMAGDALEDSYVPGAEVLPSYIFDGNYFIQFTKTGEGIKGYYYIAEGAAEALYPGPPDDDMRADFDIEYQKDNWYPMENGTLPASDPQCFSDLLGKEQKWTEFPTSTRLGWRGPMLPIEKIDEYPIKFV